MDRNANILECSGPGSQRHQPSVGSDSELLGFRASRELPGPRRPCGHRGNHVVSDRHYASLQCKVQKGANNEKVTEKQYWMEWILDPDGHDVFGATARRHRHRVREEGQPRHERRGRQGPCLRVAVCESMRVQSTRTYARAQSPNWGYDVVLQRCLSLFSLSLNENTTSKSARSEILTVDCSCEICWCSSDRSAH